VPARVRALADGPGRSEPSGANRRLLLLILAGSLWAGAVVGRLVYLGLVRHSEYRELALKQQQRVIEIAPERGIITDRNGSELAVSLPVESCFAVPPEVADPALAARLLSPILGIPSKDIEALLHTKRTFVWIARRLPPEEVQQVTDLNLSGIYFQREMERFYPKRQLAAQALGFVDIDGHGQGGIEYALDKEISGRPGEIHVFTDGLHHYYQRTEQPAVPGANVELTIDENIQYIAEKELARAVGEYHATGGTILVMNPNNGQILAMANLPTFDPNLPGDASSEARQNRAISDIYEPGSTFKTITISSALDERAVTPDEVFDCQMGSIDLHGRIIHDWHRFGLLTVGEVLMHSSDVGAIKIALKLGPDNFYHYMQAYGFGRKTGVELPWESSGMLRPPSLWSATAIGSMAMGQSVGVTALQLIDAVSAIANGGLLYQPQIVRQMTIGGRVIVPPDPPPTRPISAMTAATMRHLMEGVVLEGTGHYAELVGYTDAGKTGTAQMVNPITHRYSHSQYMSSFIGFAPVNNPAVVTLVVLDTIDPGLNHGIYEGGQVAAPVFHRVMEQVMNYLDVPPDLPIPPPVEMAESKKQSAGEATAPAAGAAAKGGQSSKPEIETGSMVSTATPPAAQPGPGMVVMPSLEGKTVRAAAEQCLNLGLDPRLSGDGLAVAQTPGAGMLVRAGTLVQVQFALRPDAAPAKAGSGHAQ
jgi:cell division protein FtsI (penicillin-binding protein 3)